MRTKQCVFQKSIYVKFSAMCGSLQKIGSHYLVVVDKATKSGNVFFSPQTIKHFGPIE